MPFRRVTLGVQVFMNKLYYIHLWGVKEDSSWIHLVTSPVTVRIFQSSQAILYLHSCTVCQCLLKLRLHVQYIMHTSIHISCTIMVADATYTVGNSHLMPLFPSTSSTDTIPPFSRSLILCLPLNTSSETQCRLSLLQRTLPNLHIHGKRISTEVVICTWPVQNESKLWAAVYQFKISLAK